MARVFVAIGSNIDPMKNMRRALHFLRREFPVVAISTFYRTEPVELPGAPPFFNGVVEFRTEIPPRELKYELLREIEEKLGRQRGPDKNAPRTIDLDLLVYGDESIHSKELTVPDPEIAERSFLALPLCELAPDLILPGFDKPMREIAQRFESRPMERLRKFSESLKKEVLQ
jgi:2-amino-4-hydroxy-6-hydroxymethyldihydropteridine diphosphokinase